jgi:hypothetical protein
VFDRDHVAFSEVRDKDDVAMSVIIPRNMEPMACPAHPILPAALLLTVPRTAD